MAVRVANAETVTAKTVDANVTVAATKATKPMAILAPKCNLVMRTFVKIEPKPTSSLRISKWT